MRNVYHVNQKIRRKEKILVPRNQVVSFVEVIKCSVCYCSCSWLQETPHVTPSV